MKTLEQIKGIKFEIWLQAILRAQGFQNVLRNVEYHKSRYCFRQVDISYNIINNGKVYLAIVEAKYSSNGKIPYKLRHGIVTKSGQQISHIDNIVDETLERKMFTNADVAFLVTNKEFDEMVNREAKRRDIKIIDGNNLAAIYNRLGGKVTIDEAINTIDIKGYNLNRNIIYLT